MIRIGLVAGEASGDNLGAGLIHEIKNHSDNVTVEGIGGEKLSKTGMNILYPMERLSVMGFTEVLGRYRELKKIRDDLIEYFLENPPDVFIGIDAPDFNLGLEQALKNSGIKTVHYVSPSVYAWREYRVKNIKKSADLILNLFPFESEIYKKHDVANKYVGHPLADTIKNAENVSVSRKELNIASDKVVVALLAGSRSSEIKKLTAPLLQAALISVKTNINLCFISSFVNEQSLELFNEIKKVVAPDLEVFTFVDKTHAVMSASDIIVLASGTATLEAMLFNKPMIVVYRLSWITHLIVKMLAKIPYASLPNILAGKRIVPEYLQYQCTAENISNELNSLLISDEKKDDMKRKFSGLSDQLRKGADKQAAKAVMDLIQSEVNA